MKLLYDDYPNEIQIEVPRERKCVITSGTPQEFSTDDLPSTLSARFVGLETKQGVFRDTTLAKYVVEPIFNLRIYGRYNVYGCENYDIESINKLCKLISQPYMHSVRSSTPQDEFVSQNDIDREYWLYTPEDVNSLSFSKSGKIFKTVAVSAGGYYYEICKSEGESDVISKVVDYYNLPMRKPKAVRPVILLRPKAVVRAEKRVLAMA